MTAAGPRLILATANEHKVAEISAILASFVPGLNPGDVAGTAGYDVGHIVEDGITFAGNALIKARAVAAATQLPALADDSGLCVDVMGGAPGIFSARWAGHHGDDAANLRLLLGQLADIKPHHRRARFRCAAALVLPGGQEHVSEGEMTGVILAAPRGSGGFGYDPIFQADGESVSNAELTPGRKNEISHRARALAGLAALIAGLRA